MGRTACTEPQCLYKGVIYLCATVQLNYIISHHKQSMRKLCFTFYSLAVTVNNHFSMEFTMHLWFCLDIRTNSDFRLMHN